MNKVIRNGMVAVLYSPGYGAGWSSWGTYEELMFDPEIVHLVETNQRDLIEQNLKDRGYDFHTSGASTLKIEWMPEGTQFKIVEHEGNEYIEYRDSDDWTVA